MANPKVRLDMRCVELGLAPTRQRAQALIAAGKVLVNGIPMTKAGSQIPEATAITLKEPDHPYVSRGGLKLQGALDAFPIDVNQVVALDVGASTGGFTDCLLQRGARHVIAVDVGYGQLAWSLRQDPRVTNIERMNARDMTAERLRELVGPACPWPPTLAVTDVSFISLTLVLGPMRDVLGPGREVVALIKPQFEAERQEVGKGGVVRDPEARMRAINKVLSWARENGFEFVEGADAAVAGPKGNVEFTAWFRTLP